ncbi:MAG: helix-turn-helix domain-containing protein [Candidatus Woesearchaeota archaeon]|jgi:DNA-binding transcriptional ArsR family regulator
MAEKSFVLLSLKDDKAKNLSKALSNDTCRKILDYLASKGDATETQISKDLSIPISTVHYNMKLLTDNDLVSMDEYHYSNKGKEVIHYKIRNRYIVISPEIEDEKSLMSKLKGMIPAVIVLIVGTFILGIIEVITRNVTSKGALGKSAAYASTELADATINSAPMMARASTGMASAPIVTSNPHFTLWFFFGGLFVLIGLLIWTFVKKD